MPHGSSRQKLLGTVYTKWGDVEPTSSCLVHSNTSQEKKPKQWQQQQQPRQQPGCRTSLLGARPGSASGVRSEKYQTVPTHKPRSSSSRTISSAEAFLFSSWSDSYGAPRPTTTAGKGGGRSMALNQTTYSKRAAQQPRRPNSPDSPQSPLSPCYRVNGGCLRVC